MKGEEVQACLEFVRIRLPDGELGPVPKFGGVFRLFMSLRCDVTVRDWCQSMVPRDIMSMSVEWRNSVCITLFALRKLCIYPVPAISPSEVERFGRIFRLCDGTRALEDLAAIYDLMPDELYHMLNVSGKSRFISK
ncbi:hypothetical protein KIN20_033865 [Parelaphostrongylus tenuis]|uniref:Uncharacterized protein n=1 Tax=Parelaphostrongylus tenuis TaxID=148309 RepID=A0AAD5RBA0_PARTN|nr:hypothetical protein KIN20_033865 [Parelaphostrongylus tenuis]